MNRTTSGARLRRRLASGILAAAAVTTLAGWSLGQPASAAGLTASTTVLSSAISDDGQRVTATVTVRLGTNKNGFGITPSGTVKFTDDLGDNLGSVAVPSCLLKPCTASYVIPISRFSSGVQKLRANYSGDTILKPSSAQVPLAFGDCSIGDCEADVSTATAIMNVDSDSDSGYIVADFDGAGLPCGVPNGGPVGHIAASGLTDDKDVYYMLSGAPANAYAAMLYDGNFGESSPDWFCYMSQDPFDAYSPDGYHTDFPADWSSYDFLGPAPQIVGGPYNGWYVGLLAYCGTSFGLDDSSFTVGSPCLDSYSLYPVNESGNQWDLSVYLDTPPGDPLLSGKKLLAPKKN